MKEEKWMRNKRTRYVVLTYLGAVALLVLGGAMAADLNLGRAVRPVLNAASAEAQVRENPRMIVEKAFKATQLPGVKSKAILKIVTPGGNTRQNIWALSKLYPDGTEKKYFEDESSNKRVLLWDKPSGPDQFWVKERGASARSASLYERFMGSALILEDLCVPDLDAFDFKILENKATAYLIEMTPKRTWPGIGTPGATVWKRKLLIEKPEYLVKKPEYLVTQIEYLNAAGTKVRRFSADDFKLVDEYRNSPGHYRAWKLGGFKGDAAAFIVTSSFWAYIPQDFTFEQSHLNR